MSRRTALAGIAAAAGLAAVLAAGYAAAGQAGLVDVATVVAVGLLLVARGGVQGQGTRPVRINRWRDRMRPPAVGTAEFPAYRKIVADLSWGLAGGQRNEDIVRRMLARLAAALGRPDAVTPGADLATLDSIVAALEEDR